MEQQNKEELIEQLRRMSGSFIMVSQKGYEERTFRMDLLTKFIEFYSRKIVLEGQIEELTSVQINMGEGLKSFSTANGGTYFDLDERIKTLKKQLKGLN